MFYKILIAERGAFALRLIQACKELGIKTVAIYSTSERDSLHLRYADETVCVGPPQVAKSYQSIESVITAAEITNSEAILPGYSFWAQNLKLANLCEQYGIKYIGQNSENLEKLRSKLYVKKVVKNTGVHVLPFFDGINDNIEEAKKVAKKISYPFAAKTSLRDVTKSLRVFKSEADLEKFFANLNHSSSEEFAKNDIYLEKYLEEARCIDIQIIIDNFGNASHFSERESTIRFKNRKIVVETPSPFLKDDLRKKIGDAAIKVAKALSLQGLCTVEFVIDKGHNYYFNDIFTNIQPEISVTEEALNIDLVKEHIKIFDGSMFSKINHFPKNHAIGCEIYAEDSAKSFTPSFGSLNFLNIPSGRGVRVDSHLFGGYNISPLYSSSIARIVSLASTRTESLIKMKRCLTEFETEGISNTSNFVLKILENEKFNSGEYSMKSFE